MRIKVIQDGPYLVSGGVPLREMVITPVGAHYELREGRSLPQEESYALCRCGGTKNAPFCDGTHLKNGYNGLKARETAVKLPYNKRVQDVTSGKTLNLLDDGRCAFARFCHTEQGDVWSATENDTDPQARTAAIQAAKQCVAGRLVMTDKQGKVLEEENTPEIIILQDVQKNASAGIFVKGPIVVEAADGTEYEVRNRVALCRCGYSENKPFCDATHISVHFNDGHIPKGE